MMKSVKLKTMPYAQCCVRLYDDGTIVFQSYATDVIEIDADGWMSCTGTYSQTTRKQMGRFMSEYVKYPNGSCGSYYDAKRCYENHERFNIYTGEVEQA